MRREGTEYYRRREDEAPKTTRRKRSPATPNAASPGHHPHPPPLHSLTALPAGYDLGIRLRVANPVQLNRD